MAYHIFHVKIHGWKKRDADPETSFAFFCFLAADCRYQAQRYQLVILCDQMFAEFLLFKVQGNAYAIAMRAGNLGGQLVGK